METPALGRATDRDGHGRPQAPSPRLSARPGALKKAKILPDRREASLSSLLAQHIEFLVGNEEAYEEADRQAIALLDEGFHLRGVIGAGRDERALRRANPAPRLKGKRTQLDSPGLPT